MSIADTGFAQFHFIVRGNAVLEYDGRIEHLSAGDLALFPKGATHAICDHPDSPATSGQDLLEALAIGEDPFAEGQHATRMICGHFEYDLSHQHPFMRDLPSGILLRTNELQMGNQMSALLSLIVNETGSTPMGSRIVAQHLSHALFASILRSHFEQSGTEIGFYSGLRDQRIILAISAIHEPHGWKYSLTNLAAIAGMSRSSFATTFKALTGQTPGEYALTWTMLKARQALLDQSKTIDQIAHEFGYGSGSAFSRAFRETFNLSPSEVRSRDKTLAP